MPWEGKGPVVGSLVFAGWLAMTLIILVDHYSQGGWHSTLAAAGFGGLILMAYYPLKSWIGKARRSRNRDTGEALYLDDSRRSGRLDRL